MLFSKPTNLFLVFNFLLLFVFSVFYNSISTSFRPLDPKYFLNNASFMILSFWTTNLFNSFTIFFLLIIVFLLRGDDDKKVSDFLGKIFRINHAWWILFRQCKYIIVKCNKNHFSFFPKFFYIKRCTCFFVSCIFHYLDCNFLNF